MPYLGKINLSGRHTQSSGAAFILAQPAKRDALIAVAGGEVEVRQGEPYVVARTVDAHDAEVALQKAHSTAQDGLDIMSVLGVQDLLTRDVPYEHVVWWTGSSGLILRAVSTVRFKFNVPGMGARLVDSQGNDVTPVPKQPRHHIAYRYYRLAQSTDDLFDAYRNMYLAFESLLSSYHPKRKKEQEIAWLERALTEASASVSLNGLRLPDSPDPVRSLIDVIYKQSRLALFHAKNADKYFAPDTHSSQRELVARALPILTEIVLRMSKVWQDASRTGGFVFSGWIYSRVEALLQNDCTAFASDFDGPHNLDEADLSHPRFQSAIRLQARLAPELKRGKAPAILCSTDDSGSWAGRTVRQVDVATAGSPFVAHTLEAPLDTSGLTRFEALLHAHVLNENQPRTTFER